MNREKDSASGFSGINETRHSQISLKVENAIKHGAIGLIIVTDPLNHMLLTSQGHPWPALSRYMPQDNLPVEMDRGSRSIPVIQAGESVIKAPLHFCGFFKKNTEAHRPVAEAFFIPISGFTLPDENFTPHYPLSGQECNRIPGRIQSPA
ncbi:MAG: hypothetical protein MZV63_58245 [Marinilabiliales bacterium]|nr:hypothetical protein [Marinilabiliales bacterium]